MISEGFYQPAHLDKMRHHWHTEGPWPYLIFDDFLAADRLDFVSDLPGYSAMKGKAGTNLLDHRHNRRHIQIPRLSSTRFLAQDVASAQFLKALTRITAIERLQPDPQMSSEGLHILSPGAETSIHRPFNRLPARQLWRRLRATLFLSPGDTDAGGELVLHHPTSKAPVHTISPVFNRFVLLETTSRSFQSRTRLTGRKDLLFYTASFYTREVPDNYTGEIHGTEYLDG